MAERTNVTEFIEIKGWKALGNELVDHKFLSVVKIEKESPEVSMEAGGNKSIWKPQKRNRETITRKISINLETLLNWIFNH